MAPGEAAAKGAAEVETRAAGEEVGRDPGGGGGGDSAQSNTTDMNTRARDRLSDWSAWGPFKSRAIGEK